MRTRLIMQHNTGRGVFDFNPHNHAMREKERERALGELNTAL
jgi:hypothetical protein